MITITNDVKACADELSAAIEAEEQAIKTLSELAASGCKDNELLNSKIKEMTAAHNMKMDLMERKEIFYGTPQS
jgi:hypothetical protein